MNKRNQRFLFILLCVFVFSSTTPGAIFAQEDFPNRVSYPDISLITLEQMAEAYQDALIIDVRSKFEYDTIHMTKARSVPLASDSFIYSLGQLRDKQSPVKIVFYCNGHACKKSYQAAELASQSGFENVCVFDAGIFNWAKNHPEKTVFLKESPAPVDKLARRDKLESKFLPYPKFLFESEKTNTVVIDIRESFQREVIPGFKKTLNVPSDKLVIELALGLYDGKRLLIYDAVGKQVEWLYYHLEMQGFSNYQFLKNGVAGIPKEVLALSK